MSNIVYPSTHSGGLIIRVTSTHRRSKSVSFSPSRCGNTTPGSTMRSKTIPLGEIPGFNHGITPVTPTVPSEPCDVLYV